MAPDLRARRLLALVYALTFSAVGIQLPFFTPALLERGLSPTMVGVLWAVRSATQIVSPSMFGLAADRLGSGRVLAMVAVGAQALTSLALTFVHSPTVAVIVFALAGLIGGASTSLIDGLVLFALGERRRDFGAVRLWGSVGFGAGALGYAFLDDALALPSEAPFLIAAALSVCGVVALTATPPLPRPRLARWGDATRLLFRLDVVVLGGIALFVWASHGAYSTFLAPLTGQVGGGARAVGAAITLAIVVEVGALAVSSRVLDRLGARRVLLVVTVVAIARWLGLASATTLPVALALHALHGITFGLFYPALVMSVAARVPDALRQTGQGVVVTGFLGAGGVLGNVAAGRLLDDGARATWAGMSVFAAVALVLVVLMRERAYSVAPVGSGDGAGSSGDA